MNWRQQPLDGLRPDGEHEPQDERLRTALAEVYEFAFQLPGYFVQDQDRVDLFQSVVASLLAAPLAERERWAPEYLRTCVRNEARKRWKRRNRAPSALDPEEIDGLADDKQRGGSTGLPPEFDEGTRGNPDRSARERFIKDLPPFQRRVLELRLADVSIHAIAVIVERSRSQVQAALREVRRKLERLTAEREAGGGGAADRDGLGE